MTYNYSFFWQSGILHLIPTRTKRIGINENADIQVLIRVSESDERVRNEAIGFQHLQGIRKPEWFRGDCDTVFRGNFTHFISHRKGFHFRFRSISRSFSWEKGRLRLLARRADALMNETIPVIDVMHAEREWVTGFRRIQLKGHSCAVAWLMRTGRVSSYLPCGHFSTERGISALRGDLGDFKLFLNQWIFYWGRQSNHTACLNVITPCGGISQHLQLRLRKCSWPRIASLSDEIAQVWRL